MEVGKDVLKACDLIFTNEDIVQELNLVAGIARTFWDHEFCEECGVTRQQTHEIRWHRRIQEAGETLSRFDDYYEIMFEAKGVDKRIPVIKDLRKRINNLVDLLEALTKRGKINKVRKVSQRASYKAHNPLHLNGTDGENPMAPREFFVRSKHVN